MLRALSILLLSLSAVLSALASHAAQAEGATASLPPSEAEIARRRVIARVAPSIVSVTAYERVPDGVAPEGRWELASESPMPGFARACVSSGIVVDMGGSMSILCCRSPLLLPVGSFADRFDVESESGARLEVELVGAEPTINLAVLRPKDATGVSTAGLAPARIGTVSELQPGDDLFALGDPFGAARTFAPGVVMSLPQASCYQADLTGSLIHASMAVCPGALGGALANRDGVVVGLIVPPPAVDPRQRTSPEPFVTYGLQAQTALAVGEALQRKRSTASPFVGFSVLNLAELRAKLRDDARFAAIVKPEHGLYIDDLFTPSPAAREGVQVGDFVMEINGQRIATVADFQQALYYFAGTRVPVRIFRGGKMLTPMISIEARPAAANRP